MLMCNNSGVSFFLSVRSFATYFAGSQYITCESFRLVFTSIAG